MKILVIIITFNSEKWIEKNISSMFQGSKNLDILVIDNGSHDRTVSIVKKKFPAVQLIESSENLGFGKANNIGFKIAREGNYDFVFLVNHDGWLFQDFWEQTLPILSSVESQEYGLLSPVHFDSSEVEYDYGFKKYIDGKNLQNASDKIVDVEYLNGAFLLISKKCLDTIKGFDPIFYFYGEDIDMCQRVKKHGFKIGIIKDAKVVHDRKERKMTTKRLEMHLYANSLLQLKNTGSVFFLSFFKTIISNLILAFNKNLIFGYIPKLYIKTALKLILNYKSIRNSFITFK